MPIISKTSINTQKNLFRKKILEKADQIAHKSSIIFLNYCFLDAILAEVFVKSTNNSNHHI